VFHSIGLPELLIVLGIILVIFGPKRLPGLGRSLGSGMREFKNSIAAKPSSQEDEAGRLEAKPAATAQPDSEAPPELAQTPVADGDAGERRS
jgi:sec-independent protein translocase protein TatA